MLIRLACKQLELGNKFNHSPLWPHSHSFFGLFTTWNTSEKKTDFCHTPSAVLIYINISLLDFLFKSYFSRTKTVNKMEVAD